MNIADLVGRSRSTAFICLLFLFLSVFALHGKPVPFVNEYLYLLRLEPGFLPTDWSFSDRASEHWLFNFIFSFPAYLFSIETVGWMGRITFWFLCLAALIRLGERWGLPHWAIAIAIGSWLAFNQSIVNAEWIIGTFEAKSVAYTCLLFALYGFTGQRMTASAILLGLSFSFHPAVGLWAIPSVGMALLFVRTPVTELSKVIGITFLFSLPGLLPILTWGSASGSFSDWQFIVTTHMPYHFDPFSFSRLGLGLLGLMLAFNVVALWKTDKFGLRFILGFQAALAGFFIAGFVLRGFEMYHLLSLMPLRLFPVLTPLFFLFTAFYWLPRISSNLQKAGAGLFVVIVIGLLHPFDKGVDQLRQTKDTWRAAADEYEAAMRWVSLNTPSDAVILAPPNDRRGWYLSRREQIVSYSYPRYERLTEWRRRLADVTMEAELPAFPDSSAVVDAAFEGLSVDKLTQLSGKYSARFLVSRTSYPFPVIFEAGPYKIYRLP